MHETRGFRRVAPPAPVWQCSVLARLGPVPGPVPVPVPDPVPVVRGW